MKNYARDNKDILMLVSITFLCFLCPVLTKMCFMHSINPTIKNIFIISHYGEDPS